MHRQKTIIITVMMVAILFMGVGYALLSSRLDISGSTAVTSTWRVEFSSIRTVSTKGGAHNEIAPSISATTANFLVDLIVPGDEIIYEIDITNYGDIDAEIQDAIYSVEGSDAIYVYISGVRKGTIIGSCEGLTICPTVTLTLRIGYDSTVEKDPEEKSKDIEITLDIGQYVDTNPTPDGELIPELEEKILLIDKILSKNTAQIDSGLNFTRSSSNCEYNGYYELVCYDGTNGDGLYYTSTNTEENKRTYYFRGNVETNYVKLGNFKTNTCEYNGTYFNVDSEEECTQNNVCHVYEGAGYYYYDISLTESECVNDNGTYLDAKATYEEHEGLWRIVRINEDGSIRLITHSSVGTSKFNDFSSDNSYVGYMYGIAGSDSYNSTHSNINSSTIKKYLDTWYENNLKTNYSNYLADAGFCNDRSLSSGLGYGTDASYYMAMVRLARNTPQYRCTQQKDLFTVSGAKGNNALTYPIGLISADEVVYAGGFVTNWENHSGVYSNFNSYINGYLFYTMTPTNSYFNLSKIAAVDFGGGINNDGRYINGSLAVRPVINLKADVVYASGDGTYDNPYTIKIN